jgi:hypothetical protein
LLRVVPVIRSLRTRLPAPEATQGIGAILCKGRRLPFVQAKTLPERNKVKRQQKCLGKLIVLCGSAPWMCGSGSRGPPVPSEHISRWSGCTLGRPECSDGAPCAIHNRWKHVRDAYLRLLKQTTIADLVAKGALVL